MKQLIAIVAMMIGMTSTAQTKTRNEADLFKQDGVAYEYRQVIYLQYIHSAEPISDFSNKVGSVTGKELAIVYNYMYEIVGEEAMPIEDIEEMISDGEVVYLVYKMDGKMISFLADEYDIILTIK